MASGVLSKIEIPAGVDTTVYTAPAGKTTAASLVICNTSFETATIDVAIPDTFGFLEAGKLEHNLRLLGESVYTLSGLVLGSGASLVVVSNRVGCNAVVMGYEE